MKPAVFNRLQPIRWLKERWRVLCAFLLSSLLLSGCVRYDVGVNIEGAHRGAIVQHIKLEERLTNFSGSEVTEWLNSIERRAGQLEGRTQRISDRELTVTIPFNNTAELESKFNQFFNPVERKKSRDRTVETVDLPNFDSKLHLDRNNFILWQRNRLSYNLDLRSLGVLSANGNVVISPGTLLDLQFGLQTPWGARSVRKGENAIAPEVDSNGHQLAWKLKPGDLNHIEAVFWLPSPLGIGTLLIALLVLGGFYLKYKSFPWQATEIVVPANLSNVR